MVEPKSAGAAGAAERIPLPRGLGLSFLLAYVVAAGALAWLVVQGGTWNVIANTRLLDLLSRGGIVALTDADQGLVQGVPDLSYYVASQDAIDWELVLVAAALFIGAWALKAAQFHGVARFVGIGGPMGQHARAWFYGHGINRLFPFDLGKVAAASALEGQGARPDAAAQAVFIASLFAVFDVVALGAYGIFAVGLGQLVQQLFWAVVILLVVWLLIRPGGEEGRESRAEARAAAGAAAKALARRPGLLAGLGALGVGSIVMVDFGAYALAQAFTSTNVILNVEGDVLLMAILAGYIARLVAFTPGGLGQWEWAFVAALYAGGLGFPECVTLAILVTGLRYLIGALVFGVVTTTYGVETSLSRVFSLFRRPTAAEGGAS